MKNKNLIIALIIGIFSFLLASCGGQKHTEHTWDDGTVTLEATCNEPGILTICCTGCDETKEEAIEALGHLEVADQGYAATCTSTGLTDGSHCGRCDTVIIPQTIIYRLEHTYDDNFVCTGCHVEKHTDGLIFELNNGEQDYSVVGYTGNKADVFIPSTYNGLPVVRIGQEAFKETAIETIRIPESITTIEEGAFLDCEELVEVTIPSSVNVIKHRTFSGCEALEYVTFLGNIRGLGDEAFNDCQELRRVTLPDTVESIGEACFENCLSLYSINLPEGLTYLGAFAFNYCQSLASITIPSTVSVINGSTFFQNRSLNNLVISNGVQEIHQYAFASCFALTQVNIPASVKKVEPYAFAYSEYIKKFVVDSNNTYLDSRNNCGGIIDTETNIMVAGAMNTWIPETVTGIGEGAFFGSGTSISYLGDNITYIGKSAFGRCESINSMVVSKNVTEIPEGFLGGCTYLNEVNIKGNVTKIGAGAFRGNYRLEKVIMPSSVRFIGDGAFYNMSSNFKLYYRGSYYDFQDIQLENENEFLNAKFQYNYTEE